MNILRMFLSSTLIYVMLHSHLDQVMLQVSVSISGSGDLIVMTHQSSVSGITAAAPPQTPLFFAGDLMEYDCPRLKSRSILSTCPARAIKAACKL